MKQIITTTCILLLLAACTETNSEKEKNEELGDTSSTPRLKLNLEQAEQLVQLPLHCIDIEYPNKLNQVIGSDAALLSPDVLHPAFYGCFDWHSAVHGHWSLVRMARSFPDLKEADEIVDGLLLHLSKENIAGEIRYFDDTLSQGFERMYGWAWLLKLANEIHLWDHPKAKQLEANLKPLTDVIVERCMNFLPKLHYPIRVGTHTNTAFALCMVYDYAESLGDRKLKSLVEKRARSFYLTDADCPITWEPSGYDFLSPCLEEANIMRRVLPVNEFETWLGDFLPDLKYSNFKLEPGIVSDRKDGHLVHLDGLNFSRAWCLYGIAKALPLEYGHLNTIGNEHINHSLPNLIGDSYAGGHWLASFALLSLSE
jgi:hypothetical protein